MARVLSDARPNSVRKRVRATNRLIGLTCIGLAWTRIVVRPRVEGRRHMKKVKGPLIVAVAPHLSYYDIPAIAGLVMRYRRDITFMAMAQLFGNLLARMVLNWFGIIPVYRGTDRATESSDRGIVALRHGGVVIIFLGGRISDGTTVGEAKNGASYMALATGATVVPVALAGTQRVKAPDSEAWQWRWFQRYAVVAGEGISVPCMPDASAEVRQELTDYVMDQITALYERAKILAG